MQLSVTERRKNQQQQQQKNNNGFNRLKYTNSTEFLFFCMFAIHTEIKHDDRGKHEEQ